MEIGYLGLLFIFIMSLWRIRIPVVAQLLEKDFNKICGSKTLDDGHDCNVVSTNSLHIISIMDIQRIHTNNIAIMLVIQIFCAKTFY